MCRLTTLQLLRPIYPGTFHNVKQNLFNVVLVMDLSQITSLNYIAVTVNNLIQRGIPLRIGIVPSIETEDGELRWKSWRLAMLIESLGRKMAGLFYHLIKNIGRSKTMGLISRVCEVPHSYATG